MTFTIKLERADGTPAEPPSIGYDRDELAGRRHDPDRGCPLAARGRHRGDE
jgi:hypothetical protein